MSLSLKATKGGGGGGSTEIPEAGNHVAVCVAVIDLGTHVKNYKGKEKLDRELYFCWELTGNKVSGQNQNHVIKRAFTCYFNEKANLRKMVEEWKGPVKDGDEFNPDTLVGQACLLNVIHKPSKDGTKTYANVGGVGPLIKGMSVPKATFPLTYYLVDPSEEPPGYDWLPFVWDETAGQMVSVADYVKSSHEWKGEPTAGEEVPF